METKRILPEPSADSLPDTQNEYIGKMHFLSKGSNLSGKANLDWIVQLRNEKPDSVVVSGGGDIEGGTSIKKRIK